jgi:hypothetical protein
MYYKLQAIFGKLVRVTQIVKNNTFTSKRIIKGEPYLKGASDLKKSLKKLSADFTTTA